MLLLWVYNLLSFLILIAHLTILGWYSYQISSRLYTKCIAENIQLCIVFIIVFMLGGIAIPATFHCLCFPAILVSSGFIGFAVHWYAKRFPKRIHEKGNSCSFDKQYLFLFGMLVSLFFLMFQFCALEHAGTDSYFYHLFFPAIWLKNGCISRIPIFGFTCEYYPCYAEMLYAFLMAPLQSSADVAVFLQPISLFVSCFSLFALAKEFEIHEKYALCSFAILSFTSIIVNNANMAYTDVLNGAILLNGISVFTLGLRRTDKLLSICGAVMLGISSAIKLTGLFLSPLLFLFLIFYYFFENNKTIHCIKWCIPIAIIVAIPCYLANWIQTGNPFYPVRIPPLFNAGLEFERHAIGFSKDTLSFFLSNRNWGMNPASLILWGGLPISAIFICLMKKNIPFDKKMFFLSYSLVLSVLAVLQLLFYPAIAEARQFIPWIFAAAPLLLTLSYCTHFSHKKNECLFILFLIVLLMFLYKSDMIHAPWTPYWIFFFGGLFTSIVPTRFYLFLGKIILGILMLYLPLLFSVRVLELRERGNIYAGEGTSQAIKIIRDYTIQHPNNNIRINLTNSLFGYAFLEDMWKNEIISIPINKKNSSIPHEFSSLAEMRKNPLSDEEWIHQIHKNHVNFVFIGGDISDEERYPNSEYELGVMNRHPEYFLPLLSEKRTFLYFVK